MSMFKVIDKNIYDAAVTAGYIRVQKHPDVDYVIHNYTDACTWDQAWDEATLNCRGLITDLEGNIISRGMPKFFNSDQEQAPQLALDDKVYVADKMDGSLGILYKLPDGTEAIATRGSFASDQAVFATDWWRRNRPAFNYAKGDETLVFEIIYPENRIVVDYGEKAELVLLGAVDNQTGVFSPTIVRELSHAPWFKELSTWKDVLEAPDRANAEGFVVTRLSDGAMVKVKYEDYKRLHRYMTRVTERHVWEALFLNRDLKEEFAGAPDEFHAWVHVVADALRSSFDDVKLSAENAFIDVQRELNYNFTRKEFADHISKHELKSYLFKLLDARDITEMIWKNLKPEAGTTFKVVSSDAD